MKECIVRHHTSANELQHITKLISRTLLETAHKMLSNASMARRFLADAISTVSYLVNRSPSIAIRCQIPEEVWSGNVAGYSVI